MRAVTGLHARVRPGLLESRLRWHGLTRESEH